MPLVVGVAGFLTSTGSAYAVDLSPITLSGGTRIALGEAVPSPGIIPTDVTPTRIGEERELVRPGYKFYLMQKLPPRLWFSAVTEVTQRFETNVLFTDEQPERDYVFRAQPNVTLGYDLLPGTSVYANYFVIKDVFARHGFLSNPTFQSLSGGIRYQRPLGARTNLQFDYQIRELWQARNLRQADMLPGITLTHVFNPRFIGFFNTQLQLRSRNIFLTGDFREIDPFYTAGMVARYKDWNFIGTNTFVTNFRNRNAIPRQQNFAMISGFEINRPLTKKIPGLVTFFRAEPIWNWQSKGVRGLSGFDFRIFGGFRMSMNKPSYYGQMEKLRKQLEDVTQSPVKPNPTASRKTNGRIAQSVSQVNRLPSEMASDVVSGETVSSEISKDSQDSIEDFKRQ
ncbi:MAG: hypothetical protein K8F91_09735 [Candidatus Obscuribacterales bacterium]|nr:hypothetical protein [Candidatus Obscuribacterales bacterium]